MTAPRSILVLCACVVALWGCQKAAEQAPAGAAATATPAEHGSAATHAEPGAAGEAAPAADEQAALQKADPAGNYGAGIVLQQATGIAQILSEPTTYEGKIVQVSGTVHDVCARRGCWMEVAEGDAVMRVKVTDGEIVFPLSAKGHKAVVEGVVEKIEMTEEQHKAWKQHEAEERGVPFDPASVSGPTTMWRLAGLGARIEG